MSSKHPTKQRIASIHPKVLETPQHINPKSLETLQHIRDLWQSWGVVFAGVMALVMLGGCAIGAGGFGLYLVEIYNGPKKLVADEARLTNVETNMWDMCNDIKVLKEKVGDLKVNQKSDHVEIMQALRHLYDKQPRTMQPGDELDYVPMPVPGTNETVYADPVPIANGPVTYYAWPTTNHPSTRFQPD
jgi:hypothetical protein